VQSTVGNGSAFGLYLASVFLAHPVSSDRVDCGVKRIGIVDMGSGSARLVVYDYEPGLWYRLTDEVREPVRLGEGFAEKGELEPAAIDRAVNALRMYADYAQATNLGRLEVIATSAVREAANQSGFFARLKGLPLEFHVLSGEEEAQYGALAVANSFDLPNAWVMDLGGGSAQLSRLEDRRWVRGQAFPLGGVRLTEMFLKSAKANDKEIGKLESFVKKEMGNLLERVRKEPAPLIAMGGTIRNLAKAIQREIGYPVELLHGFKIKRYSLEKLVDKLLKLEPNDRAGISGINPDRADVILAGALVYQTVMREAGLEELQVSGQGVREGAFWRHFMPDPHLIPDVRSFSVQNLFAHYPQPLEHTKKVRLLSRRLFEGLESLHGYGSFEARLLDDAAQLHDIGMAVNYYDHHKHSAYLISNTALPGFSHREQALLALLTQYHRKGEPKLGAFKTVLESDDDKRLLRLSACLRLAEFLERSRAGRVNDLSVEIDKKSVRIKLQAREDPHVEMREASKQAGLFKRAFGREMILESDK
jgi:exopolyphosphatase / guanosine-5'-triphosphate,3'-diphosphate pyrophosphatase